MAAFACGIVSTCVYGRPAISVAENVQNKVSQSAGREKYPIASKLSALKSNIPFSAFTAIDTAYSSLKTVFKDSPKATFVTVFAILHITSTGVTFALSTVKSSTPS